MASHWIVCQASYEDTLHHLFNTSFFSQFKPFILVYLHAPNFASKFEACTGRYLLQSGSCTERVMRNFTEALYFGSIHYIKLDIDHQWNQTIRLISNLIYRRTSAWKYKKKTYYFSYDKSNSHCQTIRNVKITINDQCMYC